MNYANLLTRRTSYHHGFFREYIDFFFDFCYNTHTVLIIKIMKIVQFIIVVRNMRVHATLLTKR